MTWLAALTNKYVLGALCAIAIALGFWIGGDVHGHRAQSAKDIATISRANALAAAAVAANQANLKSVADLQAANALWAARAASSEARLKTATESFAEQRKALMSQYAASQAKLQAVENEPDVKVWNCTRIPAVIVNALGLHPASSGCPNGDSQGERTRTPTDPHGADQSGA